MDLPYVDLQRQVDSATDVIARVAVVAGGGGDVEFYREADRLGADCLIAGEVTSKIDNELGRHRQTEIEDYLSTTDLVAIGLSHAGSEYPVMTKIAPFIERHLGIPAEAVLESNWWRRILPTTGLSLGPSNTPESDSSILRCDEIVDNRIWRRTFTGIIREKLHSAERHGQKRGRRGTH